MQSPFGRARGKISPTTMFLIAGAALLAAVVIFVLTRRQTEEKKREHLGEIGAVAGFTLERESGINLPFADQSAPGAASDNATLDIPIEWKDIPTAKPKLVERYDELEQKLSRTGDVFDAPVTLRVDRDLPYRVLYLAVTLGAERGFLTFRVACHPGGESNDERYLLLRTPSELNPGKNALLFRLVREGSATRYILGATRIREYDTLAEVASVLKNTAKDDSKVLVLAPSPEMSVQNFVEALNAGTYGGFQTIALYPQKVE